MVRRAQISLHGQSDEHEPIRSVEVPQKAASAKEWVKEWATSSAAPLQDKGGGEEPQKH
jgi:hypothetical protein